MSEEDAAMKTEGDAQPETAEVTEPAAAGEGAGGDDADGGEKQSRKRSRRSRKRAPPPRNKNKSVVDGRWNFMVESGHTRTVICHRLSILNSNLAVFDGCLPSLRDFCCLFVRHPN